MNEDADSEIDSSPTAFRKAVNPILDHFAKRAASYIAGILITAATTATTTILASHKVANVKQETQEINSGTNWIGKALWDEHEEIWQSKAEIKDLQAMVNLLSNRLSTVEQNKTISKP